MNILGTTIIMDIIKNINHEKTPLYVKNLNNEKMNENILYNIYTTS